MEQFFESREEASQAAADRIVAALGKRLAAQPSASLVVTGGSTPLQSYAALARTDLEWQRVTILLSDERWVPPTHADSNEKMLRDTLLVECAANAKLLPLYENGIAVADRSHALNTDTALLGTPFACTLLGMGSDGHIASLFPDSKNLAADLDVANPDFFVPVATVASPHPRISMTLSALVNSDEVLLLFFGDDKRAVYEKAKAGAGEFPVSSLLFQKNAPVHVFWAH